MMRHRPERGDAGWRQGASDVSTDDMPRWVMLVGIGAAVSLAVALLRYAIDVLGLIFIIILLGYSINTAADWFTERDSSGSVSALIVGLIGTVATALWLLGSPGIGSSGSVTGWLPPALNRAIEWAEARGWGNRALLPGGPIDRATREFGESSAIAHFEDSIVAETRFVSKSPARSHSVGPEDRDGSSKGRNTRTQANAAPDFSPEKPDSGRRTTERSPAKPYTTVTTLSAAPDRALIGDSVRLTAAVESLGPQAPLPKGTVVFRIGSHVLGTRKLEPGVRRSIVHLTIDNLPAGAHALTAVYVGAEHFASSRSGIEQLIVMR